MRIGLLGPATVSFDDASIVVVTAAKQRVVLAALALRAGRLVTSDELAEALWDDEPPSCARVTVRNYIRRLRRVLSPAAIDTSGAGYLLTVADGQTDVETFTALYRTGDAAARSGDWRQAAEALDQALRLWRGAPLTDIPSPALHREWVPHLEQLRLHASEQRARARLQLGHHQEAADELARLTAAHPLREEAHRLLMLALYQSGRIADALSAYQRARAVLAGELGVEPGAELVLLHQRILRRDSELATPPAPAPLTAADGRIRPAGGAVSGGRLTPARRALRGGGPPAGDVVRAAWPVPRQLPASVGGFTGRVAELALLDACAAQVPAGPRPAGTVVISAIGGLPGVGKTALAVQFAHRVAHRFPDGQLYVNLRGFAPQTQPLSPAQAVRGFLNALGVPAAAMPATAEAQTGLYRSMLAGKRMLVVLDNARDAAQVRPLLPGEPGCLVILTSRNRLAWLAAADGARLLSLDVLDEPKAEELLRHRIGTERAQAEPDGLAYLVRVCAGLPLALVIAAARAAVQPGYSLAALADELGDGGTPLSWLDAGEPEANLTAVFSWSYDELPERAALMFRLLGLLPASSIARPGAGISVADAASLTGIPLTWARAQLAELAAAGLLTEPAPGRYALHELLHTYAAEQTRDRPWREHPPPPRAVRPPSSVGQVAAAPLCRAAEPSR